MYPIQRTNSGLLLVFLLLSLGGCVRDTKPAEFYLLGPTAAPATQRTQDPVILVGPIAMPRYLDRPQIVTRHEAGRVEFDEFSRWAEPLAQTVPSVLAENLSQLVGSERIVPYLNIQTTTIDYRVVAIISRFDIDGSGQVLLDAKWSLTGPADDSHIMARHSTYRGDAGARDYLSLVAAMNSLLLRWSEDIADEIQRRQASDP
jgi:uncharacterized lipoprotein YmbA